MAEPLSPEERDALAAELALGVLEGEERTQAMRLRLSDPDFAAAVQAWSDRLAPLSTAFAEETAPGVWPAIERRLIAGTDPSVRRALTRWRIGAIASSALAASLAAVILLTPAPKPIEIVRAPEHAVVAQLGASDAPALLVASYDPASGVMRIRAARMPASALAPELWVIPADGVPRSLGLVSAQGVTQVPIAAPHQSMLQDGATLAITMEPRDGAPHQAPSSAPVAAGKISTI